MSVFIIAEIVTNHNGDLSLAKEMIDNSVDAGADTGDLKKEMLKQFIQKKFWIVRRKSVGKDTKRTEVWT